MARRNAAMAKPTGLSLVNFSKSAGARTRPGERSVPSIALRANAMFVPIS
jgi:hypothetical protein